MNFPRLLFPLALVTLGCGSSTEDKVVDPPIGEHHATMVKVVKGQVNSAKVGDVFDLEYQENGSIGYHYADPVISDPAVLESLGPRPNPEPSGPPMPGSYSTIHWRFSAKSVGKASVSLKYEHRPGLDDQPPIQFDVEIAPQ